MLNGFLIDYAAPYDAHTVPATAQAPDPTPMTVPVTTSPVARAPSATSAAPPVTTAAPMARIPVAMPSQMDVLEPPHLDGEAAGGGGGGEKLVNEMFAVTNVPVARYDGALTVRYMGMAPSLTAD